MLCFVEREISIHISIWINSSTCHTVKCQSFSSRAQTRTILVEVNTSFGLPDWCWLCMSSLPARNSCHHLHTFWTFITPLLYKATRYLCIRTAGTFSAVKNQITLRTTQSNKCATGSSVVTILSLTSHSLYGYVFFTVLPEKPAQNFPTISGPLRVQKNNNTGILTLWTTPLFPLRELFVWNIVT